MAILSKTTEDPEDPTFGQRLEKYLHKYESKRESIESDCHQKNSKHVNHSYLSTAHWTVTIRSTLCVK
jgi:hypothetical protein